MGGGEVVTKYKYYIVKEGYPFIGTMLAVAVLAGYLAGRFMGTETSLGRNILMGVLGSFVGEFLFGLLGIHASGSFSSFAISVVGACICIWIGQKIAK